MTPRISERISNLEGLRKLARKATAEFYQKPGVTDRFKVKASGFNCFEVVERETGKVVSSTPCFGYGNAYRQRKELEASAGKFNVKQFGRILRDWALRISLILAVFAFFGSHM